MARATFTVDTHLFRELGELLVGRDSTALIELIKNAYDADATEVTVYGEGLDDPERGRITVVDNGTGMTEAQFREGFLRVASRLKETGDRRSSELQRRYTGAKGIGRLAAHKLACRLEINSTAASGRGAGREALNAVIDWDAVEECKTIDELAKSDAIDVTKVGVDTKARSGTELTLTKLRRAWSPVERARFFAEVQALEAPVFLQKPLVGKPREKDAPGILEGSLLFDIPTVRDQRQDPSKGFRVVLEGDFAAGEDYWELMATEATWVIEMRAQRPRRKGAPGTVDVAIGPTKRARRENTDAQATRMSSDHPDPVQGPFFEARIFVREGVARVSRDVKVWASKSSGIRVFMEGFRVLPYGAPNDDWLSLDYDYTRRPRQLRFAKDLEPAADGEKDPGPGLVGLPNNSYFGAVFLTQEGAPSLRPLVNREGFVPEGGYDTLVRLVRTAVDLCTRVRASATIERRDKRRDERRGGGQSEAGQEASLEQAVAAIRGARADLSAGNTGAASEAVRLVTRKLEEIQTAFTKGRRERALFRVVASVGTQMASFVHEINGLLGAAQTVERALGKLLEELELLRDERRRLRQAQAATTALRQSLERQASYLVDVVTPDARRRRSRQDFATRFDAAIRLVQYQAERRGIEIANDISAELKSPPMFPAELTAIFANLLTNAVKAAGEQGKIRATAAEGPESISLRVENTGVAVNLADAERWFRPYESTTTQKVDPSLGQGMGLGLTITRTVLESNGASVSFVRPQRGFATCLEIVFPKT